MYQVIAYDYSGKEYVKNFLDKDYAKFAFQQFKKCEDAETVLILNGLTGEVEWEYGRGEWKVVNGVILDE